MNKKAYEAVIEAESGFTAGWLVGTTNVLQERNPALFNEFMAAREEVWSFVELDEVPKTLKRQMGKALEKYERVIGDCVTYASRHLPNPMGEKQQGD